MTDYDRYTDKRVFVRGEVTQDDIDTCRVKGWDACDVALHRVLPLNHHCVSQPMEFEAFRGRWQNGHPVFPFKFEVEVRPNAGIR